MMVMGGITGERPSFVYVDCPWGGPDYYLQRTLQLHLSGRALPDITCALLARHVTACVILKVPANYDVPSLITAANRLDEADHVCIDVYPILKPRANHKGRVAFYLVAIQLPAVPVLC